VKRLYQLVNMPWVHGPNWWRARRFSKARARQLDAEHIAWARALNSTTTLYGSETR
jgi:hypothetical protein